jgi:hypothetical protein
MRTMLKFKYYGHHVGSRKFKYPYIEIVKGHWKPVIFTDSDGNLVLFEI